MFRQYFALLEPYFCLLDLLELTCKAKKEIQSHANDWRSRPPPLSVARRSAGNRLPIAYAGG